MRCACCGDDVKGLLRFTCASEPGGGARRSDFADALWRGSRLFYPVDSPLPDGAREGGAQALPRTDGSAQETEGDVCDRIHQRRGQTRAPEGRKKGRKKAAAARTDWTAGGGSGWSRLQLANSGAK